VTANHGRSTVSVLLNKGDEGFEPEFDYRTGSGPSVKIGDLNGDRRPDLVTANLNANNVSVLLNRGDGSFKVRHDYRTGRLPSLEIGDLNGDRRPDLVTANIGAATVSVLLNKGNGSFGARRDYRTGRRSAEPAPLVVAIGDLNGDGKPDLATANYGDANTVSVLLNKGNGNFRARREYRTGRLPISVAIGDLNGDGKPDLATANQGSGNVSVLTNRGHGSFHAKVDFASGRGPASGAIDDLNGDGKPDLTTVNRDASTVSVLVNRPGLCTVQDVFRQTLPAAKRTIARANCRVGKIRRAYSETVRKGRVISQKPGFGAVLPGGGRVNLLVSGRRP
jgi:FG-GAP-like repeat/PASTA domain